MRRSVLALFASLTLLVPAGLPDSKIEVKDLQNHPFAVDPFRRQAAPAPAFR